MWSSWSWIISSFWLINDDYDALKTVWFEVFIVETINCLNNKNND